jgi:hypothetical protein
MTIFSGKKYFNDILWAQSYNNNTLLNILERKCHVGINVVFLEVILKLYDVYFMKNFFIAP